MKGKFWRSARLPGKGDAAALAVLALAAFFLWNHPDIQETAQHVHILLDDLFSGQFFDFYEHTMQARQAYGFANAAHYHIGFYLLCAVWDLPVYLLGKLVPVSPFVFMLWTKALGAAAWAGCGLLLQTIARRLGAGQAETAWTPYLFWLCPISFFTVLCMGQYDSLCLFFLLLGVRYFMDGRVWRFVLAMGAAMLFKMFAVFVFVPLLLLWEKRLLHICKYALASLWLYLPGSLLFWGRSGDAGFFNSLIAQRLFERTLPAVGAPSLFLTVLACLYVACWMWRPSGAEAMRQKAVYVCLAVFSLLFLLVQWHPQWLILLTPFLILSTWQAQNRTPWLVMNGIYCAGFFLLMAYTFPGQLEANLFDLGALGQWGGLVLAQQPQVRVNTIYFNLVPYLAQLAPVAFAAPLVAGLAGRLPVRPAGVLADRLAHGAAQPGAQPLWLWAYGTFALCWGCVWLAPTLLAWAKSFGWV